MYALREYLTLRKNKFRLNKSVVLILSLVVLYLFVTVGLSALSKAVGFSEQHQIITDEKIEAGAWFYIFVEQTREIEPRVRDALKYAPGMMKVD